MDPNVQLDINSVGLQKELTRAILNLEDKWSQKYFEYNSKITIELGKIESQLADISKKQDEFTAFSKIQSIRNQKQDDIIQQLGKMSDQLMSFDIRIRNNAKELSDAIYKYDYLYLNNLLLPGHIGESCKFKNLREFLDYAITQISAFDTYREKQSVDLKSYKERLENLIKGFNMQIDRIKSSNMTYANEKVNELKESVNEQMKDVHANFPEIQMKNHQYVLTLGKQVNDLIKEREMLSQLRKDLMLDMSNKCELIKEDNVNTANQIGEYKAEFAKIKRSYIELAEFIKDVRFKRNINAEVSKEQLKKLANKLGKEKDKEKLKDGQIEETLQCKVDTLMEDIIKNEDIRHLTEYPLQSSASKTSRVYKKTIIEKNMANDSRRGHGLEGDSINLGEFIEENNKDSSPTEGEEKKKERSYSHQKPVVSLSSTRGRKRGGTTHSHQSTIKKIIEGNEKRIKDIEQLTQEKLKELENKINTFQIKDYPINGAFPSQATPSLFNRKDQTSNTFLNNYPALNNCNPQAAILQTEPSPRHYSIIHGLDAPILSQQFIRNPQFFPVNKRKIAKVKASSFTKGPEAKLPYFEMKPMEQAKKRNKPTHNVPVSRVLSPNGIPTASSESKKENQTIIHAVSSHFLKPLKSCLESINHNSLIFKAPKGEA